MPRDFSILFKLTSVFPLYLFISIRTYSSGGAATQSLIGAFFFSCLASVAVLHVLIYGPRLKNSRKL